MENPLLDAAIQYAKAGLSIFPCNPFPNKDRPDGTVFKNKQPYLSFTPYRDRTPTEDEIKEWWVKWPDAMIGCITGKKPNDLTIIDADSEQAWKELQEYIPDTYQTKIAKSPNGYHLYFKHFEGPVNDSRIMESAIKDVDCRTEGGYIIMPPSINLGNGKAQKYEWLTHSQVEEVPSALKDIIINSLYRGPEDNANIGGGGVLGNTQMSSDVLKLIPNGARDNTLFHIANHLAKGKMPEVEIKSLLTLIGLNCCETPFPEKEIKTKIDSVFKRMAIKNQSVAEEVRELVLSSNGLIKSSWVFNCLQMSSRSEKKAVHSELSRLVDKGILEKTGRQAGEYRIIDDNYESVCFDDIDIGERLNVRLPFALERYVEIMPKDLVVFAGVPNAGKSAIMMEIAGLNQGLADCWYFSSEMGRINWKKRLQKYDGGSKIKWKYKFVDDFPNFVDVIKPDAFNFIDYVEVTDGEFYRIPSILASIQKRLKSGIAFVALQKNPDKSHGVGGHQTLAKPALFCTIDPDYPNGAIMRVVKAKNYIDVNPNGFMLKFKIINGINLKPGGTWMPE